MRLIKCQKCSTQFNVDTDKAKTDVFTVVCPRCGQKYQLRKAGAEVAKPPVGRVAQVGSVGSPKGQVPPAPVAGIAPDLDLSKFNPRSGWQYHLYASTKWIPYWKHVALSLYLNKLIQGVSTAFKDLTSSGRLTKEHVTAIRSNMTATCSTVFRASISPVLRDLGIPAFIEKPFATRFNQSLAKEISSSLVQSATIEANRASNQTASGPPKKDTHQQPVTNGTNARINAPAPLPVETSSQQVINEVASAPLRSAAPLQVEAPDKPPLNPGQTQTPRSKRTHNPWLIGSLSALLLGVGIYGLIELSKRHTLTEAERSQAGDWFSDLRSEQWVLVSSADPSATEYLLTLNPSPVTADSYGKTTIRLEVELRPTASGTNERYVAVEERPYTDLSEPSELYLTDGNEEIGAGTSIMLRRITSDSIIVEFRSEDGVGDVLGGVTEKRFAALREAAILHEANALVRTVDSLLQGGGLVRRGIFRSYACGEECVASFLILQNGQPVHAAYVCNNNRFGEIQLSQGNMIGVGDFTNQALVGSSFLIVTQRTMVENEEGESAPVDVITGLLPFTDEEVTPELQQRLAVAANVDMLAASRADGISVAGVAQQFIGDGEVRELKDVEEQPQFPGGADAMYSFLNRSVKYPEAELDAGVQGKVYVEFVVASDGSLRDAKVKRGVADGLDREALRVVRTMTRWTPGRVNGKPVSCRYILPITFALR